MAIALMSRSWMGMAILDISDVSKPKTISRLDWSPPYGGYAHTTCRFREESSWWLSMSR